MNRKTEGLLSRGTRYRRWFRDDRVQAAVIALFFAVGVLGHAVLPEWMEILTPPVLWVYGLITVALATVGAELRGRSDGRSTARRRLVLWVAVTYLITFTLEAVGTATGLIFGPYTYGDVLGLMVVAVPVVIGFNWVLVVLGALRMVQRFPAWAAVPGAAILTTAFDYLMEPVAVHLGYWTWHWDGIPPQNYLAWFLTSFAAALAFRGLKLRIGTRLPAFYLIIQALFFLSIRLVAGF